MLSGITDSFCFARDAISDAGNTTRLPLVSLITTVSPSARMKPEIN